MAFTIVSTKKHENKLVNQQGISGSLLFYLQKSWHALCIINFHAINKKSNKKEMLNSPTLWQDFVQQPLKLFINNFLNLSYIII